jgi:hypothetical protein
MSEVSPKIRCSWLQEVPEVEQEMLTEIGIM